MGALTQPHKKYLTMILESPQNQKIQSGVPKKANNRGPHRHSILVAKMIPTKIPEQTLFTHEQEALRPTTALVT